ncbi:T9SS type A sorting domain-containing protein [Chryseolinea sp. T2]|uniref:T9SS type A sorting domain-containing protein n=1 Tax=Chryseolinea sp. T2 TaxID=3129255 RepID=UPI00307883B3
MKHRFSIACMAISFIICSIVPALSQWKPQSDGLEGGQVSDLYSDGVNIFAATSASLYVSGDGGQFWRPISLGIGDFQPRCVTGSGANLYLGANFGGMFSSKDGGKTWAKAGSEITSAVRAVHIFHNRIFAGTSVGVYTSSNNGGSWNLANSGLSNNNTVWSFTSNENSIFVSTGDGVYESKNDGTSWTRVGANISATTTVIIKGETLYVSAGNEVRKSTLNEGGWSDWSIVSNGLPVDVRVTRLFSYGDEILAATTKGVYRADAQASNWTLSSDALPDETSVYAFVVHGGKVLSGTNTGIYVASNANNWSAVNSGLNNPQVSCFISSNGNIYAGTNAGVFRSADEGVTWRSARTELTGTGIYVLNLLSDGTRLYAATQKGVYVSNDNGDHWEFSNNGIPINHMPTKFVKHKDKILAGFSNFGPDQGTRIYSTTDGSIWTELTSNLPASSMVGALVSTNGILYAGVDASLYKSTNDGATWTLLKSNTSGGDYLMTLAADGDKISYVLFHQLFRSVDGGANWQTLNVGSISGQTSLELKEANIFLGESLSNNVVMWSKDSGGSFVHGGAGLSSRSNTALFVYNDKLFGGFTGHQSIWVRSLSDFAAKMISFSPLSGPPSTTVTITGNNFDTTPDGNSVAFNGVAAKVVSATATTLTVTVPSTATTGKIVVMALGQTTTSTVDFTVEDVVTAIEFPGQESFTVFPNPVDNIVNVEISMSAQSPATIVIYDMMGHVIQKNQMTDARGGALDVTNLHSGYYIIRATNGRIDYRRGIIKR